MKRVLALVAALCFAPIGAQAWWQSVAQQSVSGCSDSNVVAWKAAVITAGGTVSSGQEANVCTLVGSLKAHSLWTIQDRIWLHASENAQQATIDIVNLGVASITGSVTFTANQGYTGDGSTGFLNTGFANGTNFTRNDGGISSYIRNSRTSNNNSTAIGAVDAAGSGAQSTINPKSSGGLTYDVNNTQFGAQVANGNAQGFWTAVRTASNAIAVYKNSNSTAAATGTNASLAVTGNVVFYVHARNQNGTANLFGSDQVAITAIGSSMTNGINVAQFQTDLNTYMTALGTNVY